MFHVMPGSGQSSLYSHMVAAEKVQNLQMLLFQVLEFPVAYQKSLVISQLGPCSWTACRCACCSSGASPVTEQAVLSRLHARSVATLYRRGGGGGLYSVATDIA